MTIIEAILLVLEEASHPLNSTEVLEHIQQKHYYEFSGKTPNATISAQLGSFMRNNDSRVKRVLGNSGVFYYYLAKREELFDIEKYAAHEEEQELLSTGAPKIWHERDLHPLLSTFLNSTGVMSKTIYHEQSKSNDANQTWTHPDMVGVSFTSLHTSATEKLLKTLDSSELFKITAYELKRVITSDNALKEAYFQAVSNSSWANYGYLVAFEIGQHLHEELSRLNQAFGIGVIQVAANPFFSRELFPARYRTMDFRTIDKLCRMNKTFHDFVDKIEGYISAEDRYQRNSLRDLEEFCDKHFKTDTEIETYCLTHNLPINKDNDANT